MLYLDDLMKMLARFSRIIKYRYGEVVVDKISIHKSKYIVYMCILNNNVKVIIDRRRISVKAYCGLKGIENTVCRILTREYTRVVEARNSG